MNKQFIRVGVLCVFALLFTIYSQEPSSDPVDEAISSAETELVEAVDFDELSDATEPSDEQAVSDDEMDEEEVVVGEVDTVQPQDDVSLEEIPQDEEIVVEEAVSPAESEVQEPAAATDDQVSAPDEPTQQERREDSDAIFRDEPPKGPVDESPSLEDLTFDIEKKRKEVIDLVRRAAQELRAQPLDIACNLFSHTKKFIYGDLYIFLFDIKGNCLAHGEDAQLIWKNMYDAIDWVGTPFMKQIIKTAQAGGGWVTYGWHNATKISYVQLVEKDGVSYVIGSGYFPHSKEEAVVNIVKGGVAMFQKIKKEKQPVDWAFSRMSYPSGRFVAGNLYLYALDFRGNIVAQGDRPGLIGSNAWNYQDENGLYVNREIVKKLQTSTEGVWVEYISKRATKKAYAEKVKGSGGKQYFIACGYYPGADREQAVELVRKAYQFMKLHGKTGAVQAFSQRRSDEFRYGDLFITVYDLRGKIIADGGNVDNIGKNMYNVLDEDGFSYVRDSITRATKEGVWTNAKIKGSFQSTFSQKVDLGIARYVVTCSYYPVSKPESMTLLVQSAASYLKTNPRAKAFGEFVNPEGRFRRGDLKLIVVDAMGLCYAYGDDVDLIWRNIFKAKDDDGRPFIQLFINEAQRGPSVVKTKLNHAEKTNFVTSLEKDGKTYVIASGYYQ